jgi:hypothetical protein
VELCLSLNLPSDALRYEGRGRERQRDKGRRKEEMRESF